VLLPTDVQPVAVHGAPVRRRGVPVDSDGTPVVVADGLGVVGLPADQLVLAYFWRLTARVGSRDAEAVVDTEVIVGQRLQERGFGGLDDTSFWAAVLGHSKVVHALGGAGAIVAGVPAKADLIMLPGTAPFEHLQTLDLLWNLGNVEGRSVCFRDAAETVFVDCNDPHLDGVTPFEEVRCLDEFFHGEETFAGVIPFRARFVTGNECAFAAEHLYVILLNRAAAIVIGSNPADRYLTFFFSKDALRTAGSATQLERQNVAPRDATVVLGLDKEVEVLRAGDFSVPVYVAVFLAVHLALRDQFEIAGGRRADTIIAPQVEVGRALG